MTAQPAPVPQWRNVDNSGAALVSGFLYSYAAGTTTPQATYTDSTQGVQNTNPVQLNSRGEASVWLDPTLTYKLVLTDLNGNVLWSQDQIPGGFLPFSQFTAAIIAALLASYTAGPILASYARTAAEIAAGVTPTNFSYAPGKVDRYGTNTTPGTTNMRAAFQAAINQARLGGADVTWGDTGLYLIGDGTAATSNALDCTFTGSGAQYGITFRQIGTPGVNLPSSTRAGILVNHSAYTVFDLTGTSQFKFYDLSLVTQSVGYPKTCFLTARNSTGESNFPKFNNTTVAGYFSACILYNYASEDGVYVGNNWQNIAHDAGACVVAITASNYFQGTKPFLTSAYTTIFSGGDSCIDHQFIGGQYSMQNPSTTSDVFYLDQCSSVKVLWPWIANAAGRSYFYCEMANGPAGNVHLYAAQGEVGAAPQYGVLFPNTAGTPSGWDLHDIFWDVSTASVGTAGATPVIDNLRVLNLQEQNTKGILISGTLQNFYVEYVGTITLGTASGGFIFGNLGNITITTNNGVSVYSRTGSTTLQLRGTLALTAGPLNLPTPAQAAQSGAIWQGSGTPSNSNGSNGDLYFRTDTPGTANQRIYIKSGGAWTGIV